MFSADSARALEFSGELFIEVGREPRRGARAAQLSLARCAVDGWFTGAPAVFELSVQTHSAGEAVESEVDRFSAPASSGDLGEARVCPVSLHLLLQPQPRFLATRVGLRVPVLTGAPSTVRTSISKAGLRPR